MRYFFDPPCLPKFFTEKWVYIRNKIKKILAADISICYGVDMSVELYAKINFCNELNVYIIDCDMWMI